MLPDPIVTFQQNSTILLVQLRAMGDMLLLTPLIRSLKRSFPEVNIDVLAEPLPAQVLENNPNIRKVHSAPRRGSGLRKYFSLLRMLRNQEFALAIDFLSTPGSALLTRLTGAEKRIGYRLRCRTWAYTHPAERRIEPVYNPLTKFDLIKALNIEPDSLELDIFIDTEDERFAENAWCEFGFNDSTVVCALAPWSKRAWRRWDISAWLEVMSRISTRSPVKWLLFATESERAELSELEKAQDIEIRWAGTGHILQAAALMKRCRTMLCADNGLKHIAVAAGLPALTIYTGSDPKVWNPPDDPRYRGLDFRGKQSGNTAITEVINQFEFLLDAKRI